MRALRSALFLFAATGLGCATGRPVVTRGALEDARPLPFVRAGVGRPRPVAAAPEVAAAALRPGARARVLEAARALVGQQKIVVGGQAWAEDCTGLVKAVFASEGLDLTNLGQPGDNGVTAIWRFALAHGRTYPGGHPVPGDLVFFKETYDRNRDGVSNDGLTHVGLVDALDADGTVTVIHRVARGVVRYRMNLSAPDSPRAPDGKIWNDWLKPKERGHAQKLTGQLFAGYATLLPVEPRYAAR